MTCIAVVGAAKSGTSALFAAVRNVGDWLAIYEMNNERQLAFLTNHPAPQRMTKILVRRVVERNLNLAAFDKQVYLVRDPRDMLISWMLFRPLLHGSAHDDDFWNEFVGTLRKKEADPASVSIADLEAIYLRRGLDMPFARRLRRGFSDQKHVLTQYPDMHVLRYEDFLDGKVDAVSEYLGIPIATKVRLGEHSGYNERSKSAGGWRHWFTPGDVETYRELFDPQLAKYDYDLDWTLASDPQINPATSSEYLERNRNRPQLIGNGPEQFLPADRYDDTRLAVLRSGVQDGREAAMIELALVYLRGVHQPQDLAAAKELLEDASARGNAYAMVHRGLGARYRVPGWGTDPGPFFSKAASIAGRKRTDQIILALDPAWRQHVLPAAGKARPFAVPTERIRIQLADGLARAKALRSKLQERVGR
ncbi:hypothetical protein GCM10009547_22690 [Sporichthya brevicatena]|uniref:Sulfotransferase domain-containing protein n=1 Tax=Sporichthya brevicatena TaxID=171442 RepID=A0ABN1GU69_9ACTN